MVDAEAPKGYISDENARWLIRAISADGVVDSESELEILLRSMEKATSMPASLSAFALNQVKVVVTEGSGPLANGRVAQKGVVTADDVIMLRRVLYASSGCSGLGISRPEAEVLFDINDQTAEAQNHPSWTDLFSKAIAFSLMAAVSNFGVNRSEALRREEWLSDTSTSVTDFIAARGGGFRKLRRLL
ncbi:MAG: hypothetical protein U5K75_02165 [Ahrensia sp.]|nr:hypothetical protein [Ahrensia sp.]